MEKLTAKGAKELTMANKIKVSELLKSVEEAAKRGDNQIAMLFKFLDFETINEIMNLGYTLKEGIAPMGEKTYIISW